MGVSDFRTIDIDSGEMEDKFERSRASGSDSDSARSFTGSDSEVEVDRIAIIRITVFFNRSGDT